MLSKRFVIILVSLVLLSALGGIGCGGQPIRANTTDPCAAHYTGPAPTTAQCTACSSQAGCARCCGYGAPAGCGAACLNPVQMYGMAELGDAESARDMLNAIPGSTYKLLKRHRLDGELVGLVNWLTPAERNANTEVLLSYTPQQWTSINTHIKRTIGNYDKSLQTWARAWGLDENNPSHRYQIYSGWLAAWNRE